MTNEEQKVFHQPSGQATAASISLLHENHFEESLCSEVTSKKALHENHIQVQSIKYHK